MILRKMLFPIFLTVSAWVTVSSPCIAQTKRQGRVYPRPVEVRLDRMVRKGFPDYFKHREPGWEALLVESFYPIGWSRDGKFAFYTEPVDEACNCYFAKLFILDLKTDKVLWSFDYDSDFLEDAMNPKKPHSIATLWRAKLRLFSDKLNEHGIVPQGRFAVLPFPIIYKGDELKTDLRIVENTDEESRPYGIVSKAILQLRSKRYRTKTLFEQSYTEALPLDLKVMAYTKSPYEGRIAIIMIEVIRGWEGPPHVGSVKIAGASLATGFE